jgi:hypothetical protein
MSRDHRPQTFDIEARYQGRHGIARLATRCPCRIRVVAAIRDRQNGFGSGHCAGRKGSASTPIYQLLTLFFHQRAQRVLGNTGHEHLLILSTRVYSFLLKWP